VTEMKGHCTGVRNGRKRMARQHARRLGFVRPVEVERYRVPPSGGGHDPELGETPKAQRANGSLS
jgi:hypothetical protein